ncbi:hypothetical protein IC582_008292 [Cucumis melo]
MSNDSLLLGIKNFNGSSPISLIFCSENKIFVLKLGDDNFLLWKFQVLIALEAYDLEIFLDPDSDSSLKIITTGGRPVINTAESSSSTFRTMNPVYKVLKRQDRLISCWLLD